MTDRLQVKVSEILELDKRKRRINSFELNRIDFLDDEGNKINISDEEIQEWRFTGLNNTDFVVMELSNLVERKNKWNKI